MSGAGASVDRRQPERTAVPFDFAAEIQRTGALSWQQDKAAVKLLSSTDPDTVTGPEREALLVIADWWVRTYGPSGVGCIPLWRALVWG